MAVVTGTGLTNVSDVIDTVRADLVTNRGWTLRRNTGSVGGNDVEVWIERPSADTVNGDQILIGLDALSADAMNLNSSFEPWATASAGDTKAFNDFVGQPMSSTQVRMGRCDGFNTGANYLRHWILTPNDTGATPAEHQYCYAIVEVSTGVFRIFGFGEAKRIGAWTSGGGAFFDCSTIQTTVQIRSVEFAGGDTERRSAAPADPLDWNGSIYVPGPGNYATNKWVSIGKFENPTVVNETVGNGDRGLGGDLLQLSPPAFSGQAQRLPARHYMRDSGTGQVEQDPPTVNIIPLCELPDVFLTTIADFDPASIVTDDDAKFLVIPMRNKTGANNSANRGLMFQNPGL